MMVHHTLAEEGLKPRNGIANVSVRYCVCSLSSVDTTSGPDQLIATDALTGQQEEEQ
jgi:hypothetical protein